jgi:hypothetical protein
VNKGLAPGDRIEVITHSGATHEFVISEIRGDILIGEGKEIPLHEIASLRKFAWSRPESPCGGVKPLGCSVPILVRLASDSYSRYRDTFYDACAQHDYCYRHGFRSYGMDRKTCDDEFLLDMQNTCPVPAVSAIGKTLEVLDGSVGSRNTCLSVADDFYAVVRKLGEKKFETTSSTYCEFNGPPAAPR